MSSALVLMLALLAAGCGGGAHAVTHAHAKRSVAPRAVPRATGAYLFEGHCSVCHTLIHPARRQEVAGPDLTRVRLTAAQVRSKIVHGGPGMPAMGITKAQVDLVAPYVEAASERLGRSLPHPSARMLAGRRVFKAECGMCHELADAHARGGQNVNFDVSPWNAQSVRGAVVTGFAWMPTLILSNAELDRLARYVASIAGRRAG
jgi:mono/diheme cytochrome c family protein